MLLGKEAVERGAAPWLIAPDMQGSGFVWNRGDCTVSYFRAPWYDDNALYEIDGERCDEDDYGPESF